MDSLRDHFLLAMPGLQDRNFSQTLTYICEHDDAGALGIVINQPLTLSLQDLIRNLNSDAARLSTSTNNPTIMFGGPVQEDRGFILHTPGDEWEQTLQVSAQVSLSTSLDVLIAIAENRGPSHSLIALGYAGWGAGQLEAEMAANAWLSGPADPEVIFATTHEEKLQAAAACMGVDYRLLSTHSGHA